MQILPRENVLPFTHRMGADLVVLDKVKLDAAVRADAVAETRRVQARLNVQINEQMRDSVTALKVADVILAAEQDAAGSIERPSCADLPAHEKHALLKDAAVAVRARRPVYKRLAVAMHKAAVLASLQEFLSHKLLPGEMEMVAGVITGRALTAAMGVYDGSMYVDATAYAEATLDLQARAR